MGNRRRRKPLRRHPSARSKVTRIVGKEASIQMFVDGIELTGVGSFRGIHRSVATERLGGFSCSFTTEIVDGPEVYFTTSPRLSLFEHFAQRPTHDDMVDAFGYAMQHMQRPVPMRPVLMNPELHERMRERIEAAGGVAPSDRYCGSCGRWHHRDVSCGAAQGG